MNRIFVRGPALVALIGTLALASPSRAQPRDGNDIRQTVLRVAYFSGEVSYSRGDDPDDWQPASLNFPMTLGDRLYTARGSRLELQTEGGAIYLAPETDFAALNLTWEVKQFSLGIGSASFRIRRIDSGESFEVDTPNAAVTFGRAGDYRIDVDRDGNTRVMVKAGYAYVAAAGGEVPLQAGRLMEIDGIDSPAYDIRWLPRPDSWDQWVGSRSQRSRGYGSSRYVNAEIPGVGDLDQYGRWSQIPEYGNCWSPMNVSADWQPYRAGRWAWQDPWGWSWVSNEPWGWAPYHYGRWVTSRGHWYWVPVGPQVRTVHYAPALVMFVGGGGPSVSVSLGGGGYVGWFPLAPRDPFVPWWGSRAREANRTSITNVTYVNRTYVTVVNQNTFISGEPVTTNTIRDARVLREISAAPVVPGPLPVVPVASSIRVSTRSTGSAPRPPAEALTRPVVTRLAPPPAPALFQEKANLIRENKGAPVDTAQAARLSPASRAIQPTRSVVAEPGQVKLTPKKAEASIPAPVPVRREVPPGQAHPRQDVENQQRDVDTRKAQEADALRKKQQQDVDARMAQDADAARKKQQQDVDARKAQEADALRKKQQQDIDTRKAQEADALRRKQQQDVDTRKAQDADAVRRKQQQDVETRKAQDADAARRKQQQDIDTRKAQDADAARRKQQQDSAKETQATVEQKAAQPTTKAPDQKKEKDDKEKKDQPDEKKKD